jgi:hypothetical protein
MHHLCTRRLITVLALARYWEMQVSLALKWQKQHPYACHRLRYEDLVRDPERILGELFAFLSVEPDMTVLTRAFARYDPRSGPGDYKLAFTHAVSTASIGRGKHVPSPCFLQDSSIASTTCS